MFSLPSSTRGRFPSQTPLVNAFCSSTGITSLSYRHVTAHYRCSNEFLRNWVACPRMSTQVGWFQHFPITSQVREKFPHHPPGKEMKMSGSDDATWMRKPYAFISHYHQAITKPIHQRLEANNGAPIVSLAAQISAKTPKPKCSSRIWSHLRQGHYTVICTHVKHALKYPVDSYSLSRPFAISSFA